MKSTLLLAALSMLTPTLVHATDGVSDTMITLGRPLPLSGVQSSAAISLQAGNDAVIHKINRSGGIFGRKIEFLTVDDEFDPKISYDIVRKMIERDKVFAIFELYGGAPNSAALPLLREKKKLLFASATGLESMRAPVSPTVFTVRTSFSQEAEALIRQAVDRLSLKKVAVFSIQDAFGESGVAGVHKALAAHGLKAVGQSSHSRLNLKMDAAVAELKKSNPEAVALLTVPLACAAFINRANEIGFKPTYFLPGSVATQPVLKALESAGTAYLATGQPILLDKAKYPLIGQFIADLNDAGQGSLAADPFAFQGYIDATVLVEGLKGAGKDPTPESFIESLYKMKERDFGGLKVTYSPEDHQGLRTVHLYKVTKGKVGNID